MLIKQIKTVVDVYHHIPRYRQIFSIFFKYGFGDILKLIGLQKLLEIKDAHHAPEDGELHQKPAPERFRMALEELGPTFVKFGQILSSRRDLVNEDLYEQLRRLQEHVAPFSGEEAKRVVEEELGKPIEKIFKHFEVNPLGAASMAQVHRATLKGGEEVVVKVQRPNIAEIISVDLAILMDVARFLDKHVEELSVLNPVGIVREFSETLAAEQDFTHEARNMTRFHEQFQGNRNIRIPRVYTELSTHRVLTMDFISGWHVEDLKTLQKHRIDPVKLSERITKIIFEQIFVNGFFHGDPHPGNMTILPRGVLGLYDFGMVGKLTPEFRQNIASMLLGLSQKNQRMVTRSLLGMSERGHVEDGKKLEADVEIFSEKYLDVPLKELKLEFVLNRLLDVLMEHKLRMKSDFYLGIKALTQVESIGKILNPNLNFLEFGQPFAVHALEQKYDVQVILKHLTQTALEGYDFLKTLPQDLRDFFDKIKDGRYQLPIEHRIHPEGFEPLRITMDRIANRLTNVILIASILICSSILILAKLPPLWGDVPIFGMMGLILGGVMACRLIISVLKHGGL